MMSYQPDRMRLDQLAAVSYLHLVGKGRKPATMPITAPAMRVLEARRRERTEGPLILRQAGRPS
jgi:hypothetical protein